MFYGDVSWIYKIIKAWLETGIMQLDSNYTCFKSRVKNVIGWEELNEIEKEKRFKKIIDDAKKSLDDVKLNLKKECIDKRDKYLKFGKGYFALFYRVLANKQINKINKKIDEFEKYLENKEKELLKDSNEKASLVLEDKK